MFGRKRSTPPLRLPVEVAEQLGRGSHVLLGAFPEPEVQAVGVLTQLGAGDRREDLPPLWRLPADERTSQVERARAALVERGVLDPSSDPAVVSGALGLLRDASSSYRFAVLVRSVGPVDVDDADARPAPRLVRMLAVETPEGQPLLLAQETDLGTGSTSIDLWRPEAVPAALLDDFFRDADDPPATLRPRLHLLHVFLAWGTRTGKAEAKFILRRLEGQPRAEVLTELSGAVQPQVSGERESSEALLQEYLREGLAQSASW